MLYSWKEKKVQVLASFQHLFSFLCWHAHHMEKEQTSLERVSSLDLSIPEEEPPFPLLLQSTRYCLNGMT